jgi:hypothetical protein
LPEEQEIMVEVALLVLEVLVEMEETSISILTLEPGLAAEVVVLEVV